MSAVRTSFALLATGFCLVACGALQGLDKFEKCDTDEECGLLDGGGGIDAPVSTDAPSAPDTSSIVEAGCGDVASDPNHCGRCGNVCATGFGCSGGTCVCAKTTCGGSADGGVDGGAEAGADGGADGGLLRCVDVSTDVKNCGLCDKACAFPNAVSKCALGQCEVASCTPGFVDCDGNAANGCECPTDSCLTTQKLCAKRVFTTSTMYVGGDLGGLVGADAKCQARAVAAALPGTYKAWLSDAAASPSTRFAKATIPYCLVDGTLVANDFGDLVDGALATGINKTELNGPVPVNNICAQPTMVWSNTMTNGALSPGAGSCGNWADNTNMAANWGNPQLATGSWTSACSGSGSFCSASFSAPLYCFQQ